MDQGSGFISRDLDLRAYQKGVTLDFSRPGMPTDNAFIESFNGKFRMECPNVHWFKSLDDARSKMEDWRKDYIEVRPHGAVADIADEWLRRIRTAMSHHPGKSPAGWSKIGWQIISSTTLSKI